MAAQRLHFACCTTKTTKTHSEYVIIIAFPLQQWLQELSALLLYTYIACIAEFVLGL